MLKCHPGKTKDLTQGLGKERHYYCTVCKSHYYKGIELTKEEWYDYIEKPLIEICPICKKDLDSTMYLVCPYCKNKIQ